MSDGKHFQLIVPNYDQTGADQSSPPLSYVRLGKSFVSSDEALLNTTAIRGDDLVENATNGMQAFKDDWRNPSYSPKYYLFEDGVSNVERARGTQTTNLLTRGGWREHTDGNRISTTRGDCVEVIQGNYKLIVLGRVCKSWDPSGLGGTTSDGESGVGHSRQAVSSGGHYNDATTTPGEVISVTWGPNEDGTWRALEQTDHGDTKSIYKGWLHEQFYGPSIISKVGVAVAAEAIDTDAPTSAVNTASAPAQSQQKPDVTSWTYARSEETEEHIHVLDESTTIRGGGTKKSKTHIKTSSISKETAETWTDAFAAVGVSEHVVAGTITERDAFSKWRNNFTVGGINMDVAVIGIDYTVRKGFKITLEAKNSIDIAAKGLSLNVSIPIATLSASFGSSISAWTGTNTSIDVFKIDIELVKVKAALSDVKARFARWRARGAQNNNNALQSEGA